MSVVTAAASVVATLAMLAPPNVADRGAYYPPQPYPTEAMYAGHATVARIFDGGELDSWGEYPGAVRAYDDGVRIYSWSWAGTSLQSIRDFAASLPDDVTIYGTYLHEPEKDIKQGRITLKQWKRNTIQQAAVMREVGIIPTRILMGWTLFPARSGRRVSDYDLPKGTIDVAAFDAHVRDKDPVRMAKKLAREQARTKLPVAVPETSGSMGDVKSCLSTLQARSVRTKFLCYFSRTGINRNQSRTLFGVPK
jgi:hypothetical protein